jgi:tetratricopeptide (TPR) repeat protein
MSFFETSKHRDVSISGLMKILIVCCIGAATTISTPGQQMGQRSLSSSLSQADRLALRGALDAYDQGHFGSAEPILRDLTRRYPNNYEANEALGGIYAESNDLLKALPYLERASRAAPGAALAHANLGAAYLKVERGAEAVKELERAWSLDRTNHVTQISLGQALMATKRPAEAAKLFRAAFEANPANVDVAYNLAIALDESGDTHQAMAVLAKAPDGATNDQLQVLAGDLAEKTGDFKNAVLHYQRAAQLNPSDGNVYVLTAEFLRHWTWEEAIKIADYGAGLYPDSVHFKAAAGIGLYGSNKYPEAVAAFSGLLLKDPENALYADLLGRSCALVVEGSGADCSRLEEFAQRHSGNARASVYAATSLLHRPAEQQDTVRVEQLLRQAIATDPKLPEAHYQLGVLEQQRSHWKESVTELERSIELRPNYPEAHYRLSRAYAHLGLRAEAQEQIAMQQKYVQLEKNRLDARMQEVVTFLLQSN